MNNENAYPPSKPVEFSAEMSECSIVELHGHRFIVMPDGTKVDERSVHAVKDEEGETLYWTGTFFNNAKGELQKYSFWND